jgi:hypothetical protein
MEATMMFLDCPAYLDGERTARCGLPAEVRSRFTMRSTDGYLESAMIRCPAGHWFNGPIELLTWDGGKRQPANAADAYSAGSAGLTAGHDGARQRGRGRIRASAGEPGQAIPRPASAPAYYLGRPAHQWLTATRPRPRRTAPLQLMPAVTGA